MKSNKLCALVFSIILVSIFFQTCYGNRVDLSKVNSPVDYSLGTLDYIMKVWSVLDWIPYVGDEVRKDMLEYMGLPKIRTGNPDSREYTGDGVKDEGFRKMVSAWAKIDQAKKEYGHNPRMALNDFEEGLRDSVDAYYTEAQELESSVGYADYIGLDKLEYSGYGGLLGVSASSKLEDIIDETVSLGNKYSEEKSREINRKIEKMQEEITEVNMTELLLYGDEYPGIYITTHIIVPVLESMEIATYYNKVFSEDGVFMKMVRANTLLKRAIKEMFYDFNDLKEMYEKTKITRPDIQLTIRDVKPIINETQDSHTLLAYGDLLVSDSTQHYQNAIKLFKLGNQEDYLFKAIQEMKQAISDLKTAQERYNEAKNLENQWIDRIVLICNSKFSYDDDKAMGLFLSGKQMCESDDPLTKLEGAKTIMLARELASGGMSSLYGELERKMIKIEDLLRKAKIDGVYIKDFEDDLNRIKTTYQNINDYDEETRVIVIKRLLDELENIESQLIDRVKEKYADLPELITTAKKLGVVNETNVDWEGAIGELMDKKKELEQKIDEKTDNLSFSIEHYTTNKFAWCNTKQRINTTFVIGNNNPVSLTRKMLLGGKPIIITLGAGEQREITTSKTDILAKCEEIQDGKSGGREFKIIRIELTEPSVHGVKVYIKTDTEVYGPVSKDKLGYFVPNVFSEKIVKIWVGKGPISAVDTNDSIVEVENYKEHAGSERLNQANWKIENGDQNNSNLVSEFNDLKTKLEKNKDCVSIDIDQMKPTLSDVKIMKKEYLSLAQAASLKAGRLISRGVMSSEEATKYLDNDMFCELMEKSIPEKSEISGLSVMETSSLFLPVMAIVLVTYIVIRTNGKKEPPRIKRILKSIEEM